MSRSAATPASRLVPWWRHWSAYGAAVVVALLLLLTEQAGAATWAWEAARWSSQPGLQTVRRAQEQVGQVRAWVEWRTQVLDRLAQTEQQLNAQTQQTALLTQQLEALTSQSATVLSEPPSVIIEPARWQSTTWEGASGTWQVRAGCLAGVAEGDPVITEQGIMVGQISRVFRTYSQVRSWDSALWRQPVRVGTASALAVVSGGPDVIQMEGLQWPSAVRTGDDIFTAGSATVPRDLYIGTLTTLQNKAVFGEATGVVRPPIELGRLRQVMIPKLEGRVCPE